MLYIARHGQTEYNRDGIYQGTLDSPLTILGKGQAMNVGRFLKCTDIRTIFHSPLGRTTTTAHIIADVIDCDHIEVVPSFREMCFGVLQGKPKEEMEATHAQFFHDRKQQKYTTAFPGGESYADVYRHVLVDARNIAALPSDEECVIVGHESVNRVIIGILLNAPPDEFVQWRQKNNHVIEVDIATDTKVLHDVSIQY